MHPDCRSNFYFFRSIRKTIELIHLSTIEQILSIFVFHFCRNTGQPAASAVQPQGAERHHGDEGYPARQRIPPEAGAGHEGWSHLVQAGRHHFRLRELVRHERCALEVSCNRSVYATPM